MRTFQLLTVVLVVSLTVAYGQSGSMATEASYDSSLAKHLGADQYGMKKYVMAFLKKGPNRSYDSTRIMEMTTLHKRIEKQSVTDQGR